MEVTTLRNIIKREALNFILANLSSYIWRSHVFRVSSDVSRADRQLITSDLDLIAESRQTYRDLKNTNWGRVGFSSQETRTSLSTFLICERDWTWSTVQKAYQESWPLNTTKSKKNVRWCGTTSSKAKSLDQEILEQGQEVPWLSQLQRRPHHT